MVLKVFPAKTDSWSVKRKASTGQFCLYLWRSLESPGVSYLPKSLESARAVYDAMRAEGYIVKAVELESGREFEVRNGTLVPVGRSAMRLLSPSLA